MASSKKKKKDAALGISPEQTNPREISPGEISPALARSPLLPRNSPSSAHAAAASASSAARQAVAQVIALAEQSLAERARQRAAPARAARHAAADLCAAVALWDVGHDRGDALARGWERDKEAVPAPIDAAARGAVPVRTVLTTPSYSVAPGAEAERPARSTASTRRSRVSRRSKASRVTAGDRAAAEAPVRSRTGAAVAVAAPQPSKMSAEERELAKKYEMARQREVMEKEEGERLEQLLAEMKGRPYTYDDDGNVVVIKPVEADKLPSQKVAARVAVRLTEEEEEEERRKKKRGGMRAKSSAASTGAGARAKGKGPRKKKLAEDGTFQEYVPWQPSLVATMNVNQGVTLREGAKSKAGPEPAVDPLHMSRKLYNSMTSTDGGAGRNTLQPYDGSLTGGSLGEQTVSRSAFGGSVSVGGLHARKEDKEKRGGEKQKRAQAASAASAAAAVPAADENGDAVRSGPPLVLPKRHGGGAGQMQRSIRDRPYVHNSAPRMVQPPRGGGLQATNATMSSSKGMGETQETVMLSSQNYSFQPKVKETVTVNDSLMSTLLEDDV